MKNLLTILLVVFTTTIASARFGHHSSHHSSHSSHSSHSGHTSHHSTVHHISHGSSHHASKNKVRSYTPVSKIQSHEIHSYSRGGSNNFLFYYLLFNHNTNTHDTIKSNSHADLEAQVLEISGEDDGPTNVAFILTITIGVIVVVAICYFLFKQK
jgi:hypothetical protein